MSNSTQKPRPSSSVIDDAEHFLQLATKGPPPSTEQLICALDRLALAYHTGKGVRFVDDNVEPPTRDFKTTYDQLAQRFPELGLYATCDPLNLNTSKMLTGDAIDDLADIVGDLSEVIWRNKKVGTENAIWHFCNDYEIHWGRHLRELTLYLHARHL